MILWCEEPGLIETTNVWHVLWVSCGIIFPSLVSIQSNMGSCSTGKQRGPSCYSLLFVDFRLWIRYSLGQLVHLTYMVEVMVGCFIRNLGVVKMSTQIWVLSSSITAFRVSSFKTFVRPVWGSSKATSILPCFLVVVSAMTDVYTQGTVHWTRAMTLIPFISLTRHVTLICLSVIIYFNKT